MKYSESKRIEQNRKRFICLSTKNTKVNKHHTVTMSLLSRVIGFVAGESICSSGSGEDDAYFTGTGITGGHVNQRAKSTSETGIQVGVSTSRAEKQEQRRQHMLTSGIQRMRATVAAPTSSTTSRLTSESEDYHIGRTISKLLKPEKKAGGIAEEHTCCVCLDSVCIGNTNITRTGCGHVFHMTCLLKSLRIKNTCPMCRWELEETRPGHQVPNVLTPVSAEQIITEEISYFPNAAHTQSIIHSRHPKRRLKELLRVFGFTLLRTVAEYIHEDNMPNGWYDDGETTDDSDTDNDTENNDDDNTENNDDDNTDNTENNDDDNTENNDDDNTENNDDYTDNENNNNDDTDNGIDVVISPSGAANDNRSVVEYSDSFPEPYSDVEEQVRDTRGSPGNLDYDESHRNHRIRRSHTHHPPHLPQN
jgi:hypothetical protein